MARVAKQRKHTFRPERYPAVLPIVDGDEGEPSLVDRVADSVIAKIVRKELDAGARLRSTRLAEELGVSRTPVSTAMARLATEGLLVQKTNHQAELAAGAAEWLLQIHKLRQLVEPEAAAMATGSLPAEVVDDLWALCHDAKPNRSGEWKPAAQYFDFALHLAIAEYCGNLAMKATIRKCWSYKRLSYRISGGCQSALKPEYLQHVQILEALSQGDADQAGSQMAEHLRVASALRTSRRVV
ncbi:putative L-lactate dehydrogenase operon regulatory protein [Posidoniimonas polymericola]|uniref:Putative L-lactate dehydrogenase operon regulatory protein n=1 Tax=Posidoniimonas polymericola TaxID=2528002 RepID=A0A5C5YU82_9BACT|nr:GntR family transcriptional regulator [Posidoniimonas polymericola]TWT78223.1 putative L-lactate dehydrogenase operon regulatory protein [Posidoniimonas polymericola]